MRLSLNLRHLLQGSVILRRDSKVIVINPEIPQWFITDSIGGSIVQALKNGLKYDSLPSVLHEKGISIDEAEVLVGDFFRRLLSIPRDSQKASSKAALVLEVTRKCNLRCKHCLISAGKPLRNELTILEILKVFKEASELGIKSVSLTGGEPFLREDIFGILEAASEAGFESISILTNGILLTEAILARLCEYKNIHLQISLEGGTREINDKIRGEGTYDKIVSSLELLNKHGIALHLSLTLLKGNMEDIPNFLLLGKRYGAKSIRIGFPEKLGRCAENEKDIYPDLDDMVAFYRNLDDLVRNAGLERMLLINQLAVFRERVAHCIRCQGCTNSGSFYILSDGRVSPCVNFYDVPMADSVRMKTLKEISKESVIFKLFRTIVPEAVPGCKNCTFRYLCGCGCRGLAYGVDGSLLADDPTCRLRYALIEHYILQTVNYMKSPRNLTYQALIHPLA